MSVWLKRSAWVFVAVLVLMLAAWLGVPALIKWQLPLRAGEALGRPVTLGAVRFRPWNLDLVLQDLVIGSAAPGGEPLLRLAGLHADLSARSLLHAAPVVQALELDGLRLRLARTAAGHYDIDDLIDRFTPRQPADPAAPTARFALYNVQVRDAELRFDDRPVQQVQVLDALHLTLPFISNLKADVEVKVEPRLAFRLNGAAFDSGAQATPFARDRSGEVKVQVDDLDLAPYLGYLPATLPVRLLRGHVSADLQLGFALPAGGPPRLVVKGRTGLRDFAVADASGAPLLEGGSLRLGLRDVQPLARSLAFDALRIDGLQLHAVRDAGGRINLLRLAPAAAAGSSPQVRPGSGEAAAAAAAGGSAPAPASAPVAAPWKIELDALTLADARILWADSAVKPAAALQADGLALEAGPIRWPLAAPVALRLKGALHAAGGGGPALAEFDADGPVTDRSARLRLGLRDLSLGAFAPYLAQALVPAVEGRLGGEAQLTWAGAGDAAGLTLHLDRLALDDLVLREPGTARAAAQAGLKQLALADARVDLARRRVALGSVKLVQPSLELARDRAGRFNLQGWAVAASAPAATSGPDAHAAQGAAGAWQVQVADLSIEGGRLRFSDALAPRGPATAAPVRVELADLKLGLQGVDWRGDRLAAPVGLAIDARIGAPTPDRQRLLGAIGFKGRVGMAPWLAAGNVKIERFPVHLFAPYAAEQLQLQLLRADAGYAGSVELHDTAGGLRLDAAGDVLLGDVHLATLPAAGGDELSSWQALALKGVKVALRPNARPQVDIGEATLTDFYSRLVVTEQGRFNLREVAGRPDASASAPASASARAVSAAAPASAASSADAEPLPVDARIGGIRLVNGRIDFTDHFVRPNYSAALTELNGQIGAFGTASRSMAAVALRGRAEGTADLDISGQLNPLARPLALDIRAKATDLELAPLSPYAGKYVGYAIERGKLTMDVAYKIDPDGRLQASNQVVLNQLTFGDKIESKDALKLPVLLAVALLKDRNGVIDINLPVSGSLNDPQFSVGGIIFKVIVNLLTKALTSPFALLTGGAGGGGGEDLSQVEFKPGTADLAAAGVAALDKVAKALAERPALKMTVAGVAEPQVERGAFQQAALERRLVDEKRRDSLRAGSPAAAASAPLVLAPADRARLLKQVYQDTDLPNKPRNALGFAKDIPAPEMEALLLSTIAVDDDLMRDLALQRGIAVRDALVARGLPPQRMFFAAPVLENEAQGGAPKVRLTLAVN